MEPIRDNFHSPLHNSTLVSCFSLLAVLYLAGIATHVAFP